METNEPEEPVVRIPMLGSALARKQPVPSISSSKMMVSIHEDSDSDFDSSSVVGKSKKGNIGGVTMKTIDFDKIDGASEDSEGTRNNLKTLKLVRKMEKKVNETEFLLPSIYLEKCPLNIS